LEAEFILAIIIKISFCLSSRLLIARRRGVIHAKVIILFLLLSCFVYSALDVGFVGNLRRRWG
jgi:hypothetical protein